jgi:hypothetical protein
MHRLIFLALIALAACAQSKGNWPSLAPRAIEATPPITLAAASVTAAVPSAPVLDANARLATVGRDLDALEKRWQAQAKTTATAVAAAKGTATSSDAWSAAQLELTALDQLGNQIADMRGRLDAIAGSLALSTTNGADVSAALKATGTLIARVEALRAQHQTAFNAANGALPR